MSGPGRVVDVDAGTVPNTNEAARRVLVDRSTGECLLFYVPIGNDPPIGSLIDWSARHAWWPGHRVDKLSNELDPNQPLR
ncbi:hypothetical protein [Sphingomonas sp. RIT328]|uniref:hypothetical protein n=1 Tax=Sphingomonas sp. RIT328 TaxID=1470591 RepID=UPI00044FE4BA|nr:hypothetical protein [Sphingomonas sp. RIT328]EZP57270.1 hypothetical protein BW41_00113 [Sphingomonas sp. RIT328]